MTREEAALAAIEIPGIEASSLRPSLELIAGICESAASFARNLAAMDAVAIAPAAQGVQGVPDETDWKARYTHLRELARQEVVRLRLEIERLSEQEQK